MLRRFHARRGISIDPSRLFAEPEERAHPLQVLRRVHRAIVPRRSELADRADVDLFQQPEAFRFAPADEPLFEQVFVLANRLPSEVPRVRVLDEFVTASATVGTSGLTTPTSPDASQPRTSSEAASHERRSRLRRTYSPRSEPCTQIGHLQFLKRREVYLQATGDGGRLPAL